MLNIWKQVHKNFLNYHENIEVCADKMDKWMAIQLLNVACGLCIFLQGRQLYQ